MINEELLEHKLIGEEIKKLEDRLIEIGLILSSNMEQIGDFRIEVMKIKESFNKRLAEKYRLRRKIEEAIILLPAREQYVIRLRYISGKTWEQISKDMDYGVSQLHRLHLIGLNFLRENIK